MSDPNDRLVQERDGFLFKLQDERGKRRDRDERVRRLLTEALDALCDSPPWVACAKERIETVLDSLETT